MLDRNDECKTGSRGCASSRKNRRSRESLDGTQDRCNASENRRACHPVSRVFSLFPSRRSRFSSESCTLGSCLIECNEFLDTSKDARKLSNRPFFASSVINVHDHRRNRRTHHLLSDRLFASERNSRQVGWNVLVNYRLLVSSTKDAAPSCLSADVG